MEKNENASPAEVLSGAQDEGKNAAAKVSKTPHYFWIDALRGLAALAVVFAHIRIGPWVGWKEIHAHPQLYSRLDRILALFSLPTLVGASCVMLFFLLSGFCIHLPYSRKPSLDLKSYLPRRMLRIYPPYLAALLVSLLLYVPLVAHDQIARNAPETIVKSFFMVQAYSSHYPDQVSTNAALWSLPIEVEMYLVYPLLWLIWRRFGSAAAWTVTVGVTLLAAFLFYGAHIHQVAGNFAIYWTIWFAGAFLADRTVKGLPAWKPWFWAWPLGCGAIALLFLFKERDLGPALNWVWGLTYLPLLWWATEQGRPHAKLADFLSWLGKISFSLYLTHALTLRLCIMAWVALFGTKPSNFLIPVAFIGVCLLAANLFYRFVELPFHNLARNWGRKPAPAI